MLKLAKLFLLVALIQIQSDFCVGQGNADCPWKDWEHATKWGDHCYTQTNTFYDYTMAHEYCISIRGDLASIHSPWENSVVWNLCALQNSFSCWMGGHQNNSGSWIWDDETINNYENWDKNMFQARYDYAVISNDGGKWYHENDDFLTFGVCKKPITNSTSGSTTSSPQIVNQCDRFIREECPIPDKSWRIDVAPRYDAVSCQNFCVSYDECKSFTFDHDTELCSIYSIPVPKIKECEVLGGPDHPSVDQCVDLGCQDFFKSMCDQKEVVELDDPDIIRDFKDCQNLCEQYDECKEWSFHDKKCQQLLEQPQCRKQSGPRAPPLKKCFMSSSD